MTDSWQPDRNQNSRKVSHRPIVGCVRKGHKRQTLVGERRLATFGRSDGAARSERVDAGGQARQLPRDSILVEHTLGDRPVQLGLRQ